MKIVMFARAPRWYGFARDRLTLALLDEGHEILGIVVESTSTLDSLREWIKKLGLGIVLRKGVNRIFRRQSRPSQSQGASKFQESASRRLVPVHRFSSHNSSACVNLVRSLAPEVIVVRGCGILRKEVLSTASIGAINPHYASLPAYRGVDVTEWSMLHGDPCAVSVHWVTEEVDTGAVIVTERIEIGGAKSLGDLRERCAALAVILFARALQLISTTGESYRAHPGGAGRQYFNLHPRLYRLAELRLSMCNGTDGTEGANT